MQGEATIKKEVLVRLDDEAHFDAISNKSAWLHQVLNRGVLFPELIRGLAEGSGALRDGASLSDFLDYADGLVKGQADDKK